eukprot:SAG31_NODE_336_length_17493_cov_20.694032_4_plen_622_part_00
MMPAWMLALLLLHASQSQAEEGVVTLRCNASALGAGSVLAMTHKLDQSGSCGDNTCPPANHWPCSVAGPSVGASATVVLPPNDCALHAGGDIILSGRITFVAGQANDCCHDGEGHGSIMCTDSSGNITIAPGAVITVQARSGDPEASVGPGGFHADGALTVYGTVNASLLPGQRLTGRNGLLAGNGGSLHRWRDRRRTRPQKRSPDGGADGGGHLLHVAATGVVVVRGGATAFGSALAGGDGGVRVDGRVECSDYASGGDGGCIDGGHHFALGTTGVIRASNGSASDAGGVVTADTLTFEGGLLTADNIHVKSAGGLLTGGQVNLSGNATIIGKNVRSESSGSVVACTNLTLRGNARIEDHNGWGGDGGAAGVTRAALHDSSSFFCEGSYADICGACISGDILLAGNSSVVARNTSAKAQGGALCGQYPKQSLTMTDSAVVDVIGSHTIETENPPGRGGAIFAHNISLSGASRMRLQDVSARCGAAIATIDTQNLLGGGTVMIHQEDRQDDDQQDLRPRHGGGGGGSVLVVVDGKELDTSLGCLNIEANVVDASGKTIEQPCSACAAPSFPPSHRAACKCAGPGNPRGGGGIEIATVDGSNTAKNDSDAVRECCTQFDKQF